MGTLHWTWDNDQGQPTEHIIPNSFYIPEGRVRLLSPQHWAQTRKGTEKQGGAGETTTALTTTLFWNGGSSRRTIPLDRESTNVATFRLSPGYNQFHTYCSEINEDSSPEGESNPITVQDVQAVKPNYISDTEDDEQSVATENPDSGWDVEDEQLPTRHTEINLNGSSPEGVDPPTVIIDEEDQLKDNPTAELLRLHYSFGHAPFSKLQTMAKRGALPKRLSKCNIPICSACQCAKATKRKWR